MGLGSGTIIPLWDKVEAIQDWEPLNTKRQVKAFLGLAGYYRRFVPNFGALAKLLSSLTKKQLLDKVEWTPACQDAFERLKQALMSMPVLRDPDFSKRFFVATDAFDLRIGAVLLQDWAGTKHPVAYLSRKLISREKN